MRTLFSALVAIVCVGFVSSFANAQSVSVSCSGGSVSISVGGGSSAAAASSDNGGAAAAAASSNGGSAAAASSGYGGAAAAAASSNGGSAAAAAASAPRYVEYRYVVPTTVIEYVLPNDDYDSLSIRCWFQNGKKFRDVEGHTWILVDGNPNYAKPRRLFGIQFKFEGVLYFIDLQRNIYRDP